MKNLYKKTLEEWIVSLINGTPQTNLLSSQFIKEDGYRKKKYIKQELEQYNSLSKLFDLNHLAYVKILHIHEINPENILVFYHLFNQYNKITSKMNATFDSFGKITGNNSNLECVPKFEIQNNIIKKAGLAIRGNIDSIKYMYCENYDLKLETLTPGNNFHNDNFYSAKFLLTDSILNSLVKFVVCYIKNNTTFIENKYVFFDFFDQNMKPFTIVNNLLISNNYNYPVNICYQGIDNKYYNYEYPRNLKLNLSNIKKFVFTDTLDNDWIMEQNNYEN